MTDVASAAPIMKPDDLLYHYASADGLLGIMGTRLTAACLWMSQIQFMNDSQEAQHAYSYRPLALSVMRSFRDATFDQVADNFEQQGWGAAHGTFPGGWAFGRYFVFSLSENADQLSQWRGYVPGGGYSIGLRCGDLEAFASANGFHLRQCLYSDEQKRARVVDALRALLSSHQAGVINPGIQASGGIPEADKARASVNTGVQELLLEFSTYFKHESFSEECEFRLVGVVSAKSHFARWRSRGNMILPYCSFDISAAAATPIPVRRVVVGPGVNLELAEHAIQFLMFQRTPTPQVDVSHCTLRS